MQHGDTEPGERRHQQKQHGTPGPRCHRRRRTDGPILRNTFGAWMDRVFSLDRRLPGLSGAADG
jgi:hypothetical protein